ncbi:MAG: DMT family transporter [Deltaproteobacteria bacterium]|nr:DMT family transporter [Deltaproteobacteria bacterium]
MSDKTKSILLLLTAAIIWGVSYPLNRRALADQISPFGFSGLRYLFGWLALAPVALRLGRRSAQASYFTQVHKYCWLWGGLLAGLILGVGNGIQNYGLALTTATKAGFLNSLYVALVPMFGLILGIIPARLVWVGLSVSLLGLFLISHPGSEGSFNRGDAYIIVSDLFWATHVFVLGFFTVRVSPWLFIFSQTLFGCLVSFLFAELTGGWPTMAQFALIWPYAAWGIFSVSGAYLCQALAQRRAATPTLVALIMQAQSVVAAITGVIFLGEAVTGLLVLGALLMIGGTLLAQLHTDSTKLSPDHPHYRGWRTVRVLVAFLILAFCCLAILET